MEENGISLVQMSLITTVLCVGGILATRQLVRSWGVYIPFELGAIAGGIVAFIVARVLQS